MSTQKDALKLIKEDEKGRYILHKKKKIYVAKDISKNELLKWIISHLTKRKKRKPANQPARLTLEDTFVPPARSIYSNVSYEQPSQRQPARIIHPMLLSYQQQIDKTFEQPYQKQSETKAPEPPPTPSLLEDKSDKKRPGKTIKFKSGKEIQYPEELESEITEYFTEFQKRGIEAEKEKKKREETEKSMRLSKEIETKRNEKIARQRAFVEFFEGKGAKKWTLEELGQKFYEVTGNYPVDNPTRVTLLKRIYEAEPEEPDIKARLQPLYEKALEDINKVGSGNNKNGLRTDQINTILSRYNDQGFLGAIPYDLISSQNPGRNSRHYSMVVNLDASDKKGSHWVGVFVDPNSSVEYYDSYGDPCPVKIMKELKVFIDKLNPKTYLKFKENKIVDQRANSSSCGWLACQFIIDRYRGVSFKECTGYSNIANGEKSADKLREKYPEFSYF